MSKPFSAEVSNFKPSKHGFKFPNEFQISNIPGVSDKIAQAINDGKYGLCGGMAHCAYELFLYEESIPNTTTNPKPKSGMYEYLLGGLQDSFGNGLRDMKRMLEWHEMPDGEKRLPKLTKLQLGLLKLLIKRGRAVQLMLCYHTEKKDKPWNNHQVLAYKVEERSNEGKIFIYEPNNPGSNKPYIDYTLNKGNIVEMKEKYFQTGSGTTTKPVHGFFIVNPRMENPLSKPSFLYYKGLPFLIDKMKNEMRSSIFEIVREIKKYKELSPLELFKLLKSAKYSATDIARIARYELRLNAEIVINLLVKINFTAGQIVAAINIIFRKGYAWLLQKLIKLKVSLADAAKSVQNRFRIKLIDLIRTLKRLSVSVKDIAKVIYETFFIRNFRTLAKLLRDARYSVSVIIGELRKLGLSMKDAVVIMRNDFRWSVVATARILKQHFGNKPKDILLNIWRHSNAGLNDMIRTARNVFGWKRRQLLKLI